MTLIITTRIGSSETKNQTTKITTSARRSKDPEISLEEADKLNDGERSEPIFRNEVSENETEINSEKTR
eukprot:10860151-Karenia_brevis.AAC.1